MTNSKFSTWTFVILLLISLILVIHLLFSFITPIVLAVVLVSLFGPMHQRVLRMVNQHEYLAALLSTMVIVILVIAPIAMFLVVLLQQSLALLRNMQALSFDGITAWIEPLKSSIEWVKDYLSRFGLVLSAEKMMSLASSISQMIGGFIYDLVGNIAGNLIQLALYAFLTVALVLVFFMTGHSTKNFIMDLVPIPQKEKERLVKRFQELSSAVFLGNGIISVIEGTLGGCIFYIFGISGALIWGVAMTITSFMPVVGATIVVFPATVYLFLAQGTLDALLFLVLNSIHLIALETIVKPKLIGTKSQMHAVLVFLSVMAGLKIYGALGLFYGPLLVTIFLSLAEIYKEHYRDSLLK